MISAITQLGHIRFLDDLKPLRFLSLRESLVVLASCACLAWYLQFLWSRRKLYSISGKVPGPFWLPFIGSAFYFVGNANHIFGQITRLFSTYPGLFKVWFGSRLFYGISDPKHFEILLSSPHALRKENLYRMAVPVTGQGLFSALSVSHWKKHRKIIMPTFNQKILDQFVEVFVEQSEILTKVMEKHAGKGEIDIINLVSRCTLDIICETAMGVQVKAQTTDSNFPKWADTVMELVIVRCFNILYHNDFIFNHLPVGREFNRVANELRSFTKKVVTEKRIRFEKKKKNNGDQIYLEQEPLKRQAFLDLLLEMSYMDNNSFTDEELLDETMTFMIAGSDTTATSNCFTLTMLGLHQDIQNKALEEIMEVVGPDRQIEVSDLPNLKYMERIIKESLRLYPVGPFFLRAVDEDIDIGDHIIPKGCSIFFAVLETHRNAKYWPDPYKFDPDRFLPERQSEIVPGSYIPFSYGPRNCIGIRYGMMAMKSLVATIIRRYRVFTTYKSVQELELKSNVVLRPTDGYKVFLELRE